MRGFYALLIGLCAQTLLAQVGVNTTTPSNASVLEVSATDDNVNYGGFMPPRVSQTERDAIPVTAADDGLLVFLQEGSTRCVQIYNGVDGQWEDVFCMPIVAADPWINEIHYDNNGSDTNEGVEIAGAAGTDLTNWSVLLYNGGDGSVYDTINLSGTIDDEGTGYGAVNFLRSGLQNGSPDGLALVDDAGTVIQFLSYEGNFTATSGAANGMTSTDIGVAEGGSSPVGESLQLTGTGNQYSDFTWSGPSTHSRGDINSGQTIN
ncbi:hypothetical protein POV27_09050 [Aureisphaera galaxeae]|uniref:hypothetical protein n=1 Tax=Aureisphaera galaxeae TaxID=1538023 RepID=UPI0023507A20|nr:hypothetical protein [Aureisphaera galaxeae]MDC8004196.1 hypothetical protein [Aureisphaera galaxeae]